MLVIPDNLDAYKGEVGAKTLNLRKLKTLGFNVPAFAAIPARFVKVLFGKATNSDEYINLIDDIKKILAGNKFVVRSSALIEDSNKTSYAGQFLTKIDLDIDDVPEAINQVIIQAHEKLNGQLELFSIIIQEYIDADVAGVCFTRDPLGNRDMVIEYHSGIGEDVVSGKIKPQRRSFYWNSEPDVQWSEAVKNFKSIERHYQAPQDIEWLRKNQKLYIVQTRPITTFGDEQYQEWLYLDKVLPATPFIYEKTEISEIAARPTTFTYDLLQKIYSPGGPVDLVYKKYGINYTASDFLIIIGNELYADREKEIRTLLPAYTYLKIGAPTLGNFSGIGKTIINIIKLNKFSGDAESIYKNLDKALKEQLSADEDLIKKFLATYQLVFEVNLLAARTLKSLELFAKKEKINPSLLLALPNEQPHEIKQDKTWKGNSLEVADESEFYVAPARLGSDKASADFSKLSKIKQNYIKPIIQKAQTFGQLREFGRWLTVKYVNVLREYLFLVADRSGFGDKKNIYFSTIEELGRISEAELLQRKSDYSYFLKFNLPNKLTNVSTQRSGQGPLAVSAGSATGILKSAEQIQTDDHDIILYTKILSPDLTRYFPQITGIVSEQGGMLSHLAIIAREKGLPVIVNYVNNLPLGAKVRLDGNLGKIDLMSDHNIK